VNKIVLNTELKENELPITAAKLLHTFPHDRIFLFDGEMGSGKTTFIKALCHTLGCNDNLSSPTFSLVNEYTHPKGKIYHFDLYRIKDMKELLDIGIDEYLDSGQYCFIEWPEKIMTLISAPALQIRLTVTDNIHYLRAEEI